jgi:hypothetical protein
MSQLIKKKNWKNLVTFLSDQNSALIWTIKMFWNNDVGTRFCHLKIIKVPSNCSIQVFQVLYNVNLSLIKCYKVFIYITSILYVEIKCLVQNWCLQKNLWHRIVPYTFDVPLSYFIKFDRFHFMCQFDLMMWDHRWNFSSSFKEKYFVQI